MTIAFIAGLLIGGAAAAAVWWILDRYRHRGPRLDPLAEWPQPLSNQITSAIAEHARGER